MSVFITQTIDLKNANAYYYQYSLTGTFKRVKKETLYEYE